MLRITPYIRNEELQKEFHLENKENADSEGLQAGMGNDVAEQDFSELHALFESQYEQFLSDTSAEIKKRARRLVELESIVYGSSLSR